MRKWFFLLAVVILTLFQVTILDYFKVFGVKPDLLLISVVMVSLFSFDLKCSLFLSALCGILKDIFAINTFGINTLVFPLWSFLIMRLSKNITIENNFICAVFVFIISVSNDIITRLILLFFGNFISMNVFLRIAFLESLYTAFILPFFFRVIQPFTKFVSGC